MGFEGTLGGEEVRGGRSRRQAQTQREESGEGGRKPEESKGRSKSHLVGREEGGGGARVSRLETEGEETVTAFREKERTL
eukprot:1695731-Rhodomonas_salina.2